MGHSSGGRDGPLVGEGADAYYVWQYEYAVLYVAVKDSEVVYTDVALYSL